MMGGELRVAADRGCGVVCGGVTCVSGHQNGLLETPEGWAEIFAEKHLGGAGNDLVGGCGTVTMGETCPALAQPHSVLWTAALGLEGRCHYISVSGSRSGRSYTAETVRATDSRGWRCKGRS